MSSPPTSTAPSRSPGDDTIITLRDGASCASAGPATQVSATAPIRKPCMKAPSGAPLAADGEQCQPPTQPTRQVTRPTRASVIGMSALARLPPRADGPLSANHGPRPFVVGRHKPTRTIAILMAGLMARIGIGKLHVLSNRIGALRLPQPLRSSKGSPPILVVTRYSSLAGLAGHRSARSISPCRRCFRSSPRRKSWCASRR